MVSRGRKASAGMLALAIVFAALLPRVPIVQPVFAQSAPPRTSFINPFPKGDVYRLRVVGDWYADGVHDQISQIFASQPRIRVDRTVLSLKTLRRSDWDEGVTAIEDAWKAEPIDIAVVMFGVAEVGPVRIPGNRRLRFGDEGWTAQYTARVDRMMKALKGSSGAVYWLSLPVVRRDDRSEAYQEINEIFRERAYVNGVKFIDIYSTFTDEDGNYSAYGPDLDGKTKLLRTKDGTYFTADGNRKIAHYAEREIKRDITRAIAERTVPLAGGEIEQKRINPDRAAPAPAAAPAPKSRGVKVAVPGETTSDGRPPSPAAGSAGPKYGQKTADLKADNGSVVIAQAQGGRRARTIKLTIIRPAIPAAVIDVVTRKQSADRPALLGDSVAQTLPGGASLMSSITPVGVSGGGQRAKLSPTQSPYFKVWAKGERLPPKKGRADDFVWPRPEPEPVGRVAARNETPSISREQPAADGMPPLPERNPLFRAPRRR